jgi:hypothetical protein
MDRVDPWQLLMEDELAEQLWGTSERQVDIR